MSPVLCNQSQPAVAPRHLCWRYSPQPSNSSNVLACQKTSQGRCTAEPMYRRVSSRRDDHCRGKHASSSKCWTVCSQHSGRSKAPRPLTGQLKCESQVNAVSGLPGSSAAPICLYGGAHERDVLVKIAHQLVKLTLTSSCSEILTRQATSVPASKSALSPCSPSIANKWVATRLLR